MPAREVPLVLAEAAVADIRDIYPHIATGNSIAAADEIYGQIRGAIDRIGRHPEIGAPRDHVRAGYRVVPVSSWVIWYRAQDSGQGMIVMRVLHGHMDADRHLLR